MSSPKAAAQTPSARARPDATSPAVLLVKWLVWISLNVADVVWMYYYVWAGTNPNPRIAVNRTHEDWTAYEISMNVYGFLLGFINALAWFRIFRSAWGFKRPRAHPSEKPRGGRARYRARIAANLLLGLPIAVCMALGPFVAPFIALPLMQEYVWNHRCDTWAGSAVLTGRATTGFLTSTATFYTGTTELYTLDEANNSFTFQPRSNGNHPPPTLQSIAYDFENSTVTGTCTRNANGTGAADVPCVTAILNLDLDSQSHFQLNISNTSTPGTPPSIYTAIDAEWQFSNDAPSLILVDAAGAYVMRTVVTKRGDCTMLKMCLADLTEAQAFLPVGLILIYQAIWATGTTCGAS